ncbi:MAG: 50S ribosomal protein L37ae [Candidatus Woesearchaeota archaeon]|jgi:large subunit ribosomal protein L37Ae
MAKKTNLTTKRFGVRYGRTVKEKLANIERDAKKSYKCPYCAAPKVKKQAAGIWECNKCGKVYTGRAYSAESTVKNK